MAADGPTSLFFFFLFFFFYKSTFCNHRHGWKLPHSLVKDTRFYCHKHSREWLTVRDTCFFCCHKPGWKLWNYLLVSHLQILKVDSNWGHLVVCLVTCDSTTARYERQVTNAYCKLDVAHFVNRLAADIWSWPQSCHSWPCCGLAGILNSAQTFQPSKWQIYASLFPQLFQRPMDKEWNIKHSKKEKTYSVVNRES